MESKEMEHLKRKPKGKLLYLEIKLAKLEHEKQVCFIGV